MYGQVLSARENKHTKMYVSSRVSGSFHFVNHVLWLYEVFGTKNALWFSAAAWWKAEDFMDLFYGRVLPLIMSFWLEGVKSPHIPLHFLYANFCPFEPHVTSIWGETRWN